jgi:NADH dehydrogenase FAD-containing subunit
LLSQTLLLLLLAQVAKQQGEYLAEVLRRGSFDQQAGVLQPSEKQEPFK